MPIPFNEFRPIYPPHPASNWRPSELNHLASLRGYLAQYKYDDWRTLVYFFPDGHCELYGRKKARLPRYKMPPALESDLRSLVLGPGVFHVLDGGLLHYKTGRIKDTIVLWDILVHDGQYLVGTGFANRYERLTRITGQPSEWVNLDGVPLALRAKKHLWLAPVFSENFLELYQQAIRLPEIEGLVLKDPKQPLKLAFKMEENASWMVRARKS